MRAKKTFKINKYLKLRLEKNKSVIYVKGKKFRQCKYLLLNAPLEDLDSLEELQSLDEIADTLDNSLHFKSSLIPPDVEYWGHCSNLQVWYENGYNTELLRSNLAFPLLKALTDAGDPQARRVFAGEIAKRVDSEYLPVMIYLILNGYLSYLTPQQIQSLNFTEKMINPDFNNLDDILHSKRFIEDFIFKKRPKTEAEYILKLRLLITILRTPSAVSVAETKENIIKCFNNAMERLPNSEKLILFYIRYQREIRHYPEAIAQLKKLIEKFPEKYFNIFKEVGTITKEEAKKRFLCPHCASICGYGHEHTDSYDVVIGYLCSHCNNIFPYLVKKEAKDKYLLNIRDIHLKS